jgi:hypothetical protein
VNASRDDIAYLRNVLNVGDVVRPPTALSNGARLPFRVAGSTARQRRPSFGGSLEQRYVYAFFASMAVECCLTWVDPGCHALVQMCVSKTC